MTRVEKIESEIRDLTADELGALRQWFVDYDSDAWDRQIEADVRAGKLDALADAALEDHRAGRSREL